MNDVLGPWVAALVACMVPVMGLAVAIKLISGMSR